jgi:hypothetical protein
LEIEVAESSKEYLIALTVQPPLVERVKTAQGVDADLDKRKKEVQNEQQTDFQVHGDGSLRFRGRLCVPHHPGLKAEILKEAHNSKLSIHPGGTKMY